MDILSNDELRNQLKRCFPKSFVNMNYEFIAYPKTNSYFMLKDVDNEFTLKCKILEWLSREAAKSYDASSRKYHLNGINDFLGTNFTQDEMMIIYTYLGNNCNRKKCVRFVESGYDMSILSESMKE